MQAVYLTVSYFVIEKTRLVNSTQRFPTNLTFFSLSEASNTRKAFATDPALRDQSVVKNSLLFSQISLVRD